MRHSGSGGIGNRLLAALPPEDFDLLVPELETVALDQDAVLSRAGDQIEHVFFPHSGAISLMIDMANGQTVDALVPVVNQIRTYWWCSPPRTGRQRMVPASLTARETGASFSNDKCVLISL